MENIIIKGLTQNNLKNISLNIPKGRLVVFTGVSGSGKSSIVFDTIAAESQRQMNETYPPFVRSRMPKYEKPAVELIDHLTASVIVDQKQLGGNARSTVGTISDLYASLRLLYSRFGQPFVGSSSYFSFNDPNGMCKTCTGMGKILVIDIDQLLNKNESWRSGCIRDSTFKPGSWYWRQYAESGLFDIDKPIRDYTEKEYNLLLYGSKVKNGAQEDKHVEGIYNQYTRLYLKRDLSNMSTHQKQKSEKLCKEIECPSCHGRRLNRDALGCWINGYSIDELCEMEFTELCSVLMEIDNPQAQTIIERLCSSLTRLIDIGLPYLNMNRESSSLSGGEAQRLKLVRYMGSSLTGMTYIFDEPSTGMHPRDVYRMNSLLLRLRDRGNTILVVEHDKDVISIADEVIDVGPSAGSQGGQVVFQGTYPELLKADTLTSRAMRSMLPIKETPRKPTGYLPIRNAEIHNLKKINVDIPLGVLTVVSGVAGSGKSSLISGVFASQYQDHVIRVDQSPITATGRSTPATFLGFFDEIRNLFAEANKVEASFFSFNSKGACPTCGGRGMIVTELVFMDPVITICEGCNGSRYSDEALSYRYKGKNILEVLSMTAMEAKEFFDSSKIRRILGAMCSVGLSYLTIGQALSTLSGGERQRIKLAKYLDRKGNIYILDEPSTGLHASDIEKLMILFDKFVDKGNTVIIIEHNIEMLKRADIVIDIGPDGGRNGGEVVFQGTVKEMVQSAQTITAKCLRFAMEGHKLTEKELQALSTEYTQKDGIKENDMSNMQIKPIGRVVNKENEVCIALDKKYAPALEGLDQFGYVQVFWWFDGSDTSNDRELLVEQKPYTNGPDRLGTFATRSPSRPNPIALSTVQLTWVDKENARIGLSYIDAENGTPVIDIKPYTPSVDRVESPKVPNWCSQWPKSVETSGDFDWDSEFNF